MLENWSRAAGAATASPLRSQARRLLGAIAAGAAGRVNDEEYLRLVQYGQIAVRMEVELPSAKKQRRPRPVGRPSITHNTSITDHATTFASEYGSIVAVSVPMPALGS